MQNPPLDLLPLSALQHILFCERQCALIHLEQVWADNHLTTLGNQLHKKAHDGPDETRDGIRITRGLDIVSHRLGLRGKADIVEFHRDGTVLPVEYKRGRPKKDDCDRVQICAQALCLEEMLGIKIPNGALFYGENKRRHDVAFDENLRTITESTATRLHAMIDARITPPAMREPKCESCSLLELCMPDALKYKRGAAAWLDRQLTAAQEV